MTTPRVLDRTIGAWKVHAIQAGPLKLDGGAMFGVVPKPLWEKRLPADARNRIPMGMRCLLVEHESGLVLIDTGAGNKENDRFYDIYGIENRGDPGPTALEDGIRAAGFRAEDVSLVINTHLHFDHAGGNTYRDAKGALKASMPNARYVVQRGEHHFATHLNERTAGSYLLHNYEPLREAGRIDFVEGEREIVSGITVLPTPGHVPYHQSIVLRSGGETAIYLGDLVPTTSHLPLPWIMGYDVDPLVTLETKRRVLERVHQENWLAIFEHDAFHAWGRVVHDGKAYGFAAD
jgi:glyoxylase-like metal-dependent hydrolase (beta-lactamase superfamily II)